jgi:hypothetical protein
MHVTIDNKIINPTMKLVLISYFLFPTPGIAAKNGMENVQGIRTRHVELTRFIKADLLTVKETGGNSVWVAHLHCFSQDYKMVGQFNTLFIKAKRS